jgi:hypothetical protein
LNNRNNINPNDIQVGDRIRLIHADDIHADVKESDTGTVLGLSTVPKDKQSNEWGSNHMDTVGSQQKQSSID